MLIEKALSGLHMALSSSSGTPEFSTAVKAYSAAVFIFTWLLIAPSSWKWFPIGRPSGGLVGASLMMIGGIITFSQAMIVVGDSMEVLCLLFGLMIIANFLAQEGVYDYLEIAFTFKCRNAYDLMFRIVLIGGLLSAMITNDAVCIFFTPLIMRICHTHTIPFGPMLLALGTSSNIGSAATITGNPQNALIALKGHIGFTEFAMYMAPVAVVALILNFFCLALQYMRDLNNHPMKHQLSALKNPFVPSPVECSGLGGERESLLGTQVAAADDLLDEMTPPPLRVNVEDVEGLKKVQTSDVWKPRLALAAKIGSIICTLGVFVAFFIGIPIGQASLTGAVAIIAVQGIFNRFNPNSLILQIDYMLMIFFAGLFITVEGVNLTGYPTMITDLIFANVDLKSPLGCALFVIVVTIASNLLSNVPAVLLIEPFIEQLHATNPELSFAYWVIAAWATTVGGNFTIIGSAANIIVAERAKATGHYDMSFSYFLKFGSWSTMIILTLGTIPLYVFLLARAV